MRPMLWTLAVLFCFTSGNVANSADLAMTVFAFTQAPPAWHDFCNRYKEECPSDLRLPVKVVLDAEAFSTLARINKLVNEVIKPIDDLLHWGTENGGHVTYDKKTGKPQVDKWTFGEDGLGDCEDYVLLKRRMLIQAGWPRQALLVTGVETRDHLKVGHALLTIVTNQGDFVLDNLTNEILLWHLARRYVFLARQSEANPHLWLAIVDKRKIP